MKIFSIFSLRRYKRGIIYVILISVLLFSLSMLFHIFYWLRVNTFILSHEVIINSKYALELSITKGERIIYSFEYSPKLNTILFYWIYGEKSKKVYLQPQLLPSEIKGISPTNTYTFYFDNGNLYPEGEILFSTYFYKKGVKFYKNGRVVFVDK
ncbi:MULTISPECIES: hypothetical protein [Dictyoglomus]|uniref:Uncharacterized protein n=1 Tax=Dictyoglomus turgidum (strain DSM 6724 / Z-1310) TaxID=515635 RepID=B8E2V0_DICTD|nr:MULTISPECIES: hypothetical protein [Dictyoglomus]ACK42450.1 conserved hypothetical protein [Dictyoglomus turgidum DSM 6724]HBU32094.1 hypothetical protein [Dictyoglomus sp.]